HGMTPAPAAPRSHALPLRYGLTFRSPHQVRRAFSAPAVLNESFSALPQDERDELLARLDVMESDVVVKTHRPPPALVRVLARPVRGLAHPARRLGLVERRLQSVLQVAHRLHELPPPLPRHVSAYRAGQAVALLPPPEPFQSDLLLGLGFHLLPFSASRITRTMSTSRSSPKAYSIIAGTSGSTSAARLSERTTSPSRSEPRGTFARRKLPGR